MSFTDYAGDNQKGEFLDKKRTRIPFGAEKLTLEEPKRKPIGEIYWERVESRDEWEMVLVFRTGLLSGDEIRLAPPVTGILMATVPNKELFTKLIKTFEIE